MINQHLPNAVGVLVACLLVGCMQQAPPSPTQRPVEPIPPPTFAAGLPAPLAPPAWSFQLPKQLDGPIIRHQETVLSLGTGFTCHRPKWVGTEQFNLGLPLQKQVGAESLVLSGGSEGSFVLERLEVAAVGPDALRLAVEGRMSGDAPGVIEYLPLQLPAALLAGAQVETGDGIQRPIGEELCEITQPTPKLRITTRVGVITLTVREGSGICLSDRRKRRYGSRRLFLVTAGSLDQPTQLEQGDRYRHVLEVGLSPHFGESDRLTSTPPVESGIPPPAVANLPTMPTGPFPQPRVLRHAAGASTLPATIAVRLDGFDEDPRIIASFHEALEAAGVKLQVSPVADGWVKIRRIEPPDPTRFDYHRLRITAAGVAIEAVSPAAVSYALGTLAQMITGNTVRHAEIEDWADLRWRGLHVFASDAQALAVNSSIIRRMMVPLRLNMIILECKFVHWPSHPEIHQPWGMPYADFQELVRYAENRFVTAIPLLASYGHMAYLFRDRQVNMDLAEDPSFPFTYDVSNPRTYQVMDDLLTDVHAAAPLAPWIHIGHDEVADVGRYPNRPANVGKPFGELLAKDLLYYQKWAEKNGTRVMLWSDYLAARSDVHANERDGLRGVIPTLAPGSAVMVWRYVTAKTYPECDLFRGHGLHIFGASGEEDPENVITYARYARDTQLHGMVHTTWPGWQDYRRQLVLWPRKFWPYVQAGLSFWDANSARLDPNKDVRAMALFNRMVGDVFPEVCRIVHGDRIQPLELARVAGNSLAEPGGFQSGPLRTSQGGCFFLAGKSGTPAGVVISRGASVSIPFGRKARGLSLLWASLSQNITSREVGRLTIVGDDPVSVPIIFRHHLGNLLHAIDTYTGTDSGEILGPQSLNQVFTIARPVFSAGGRRVLWEYDRAFDGGRVDSITITASPSEELVLAGVSMIEVPEP